MKRANGWDKVEAREAIRQAAYELSGSGVCERWQDVWHALRGRFEDEQLTTIFDNPLCRLDIEQRCYRARYPGRTEGVLPTDMPVIAPHVEKKDGVPSSLAVDRKTQKTGRLAARILDVLTDGNERTAMELAQRLGVSRNEVFKAVRVLLADGTIDVTKYATAKYGGRGARVFACAAGTAGQKAMEYPICGSLPLTDPLAIALDRIARSE